MKVNKKFVTLFSVGLIMLYALSGLTHATSVVDDALITSKIKAKLLGRKEVSSLNISVETENGVVFLTGTVQSDKEASIVIEEAASTEGVKDVDFTSLKIASHPQPFTDTAITAKIKGIYLREKLFGDKPISLTEVHVETTDGVVYLTGKVDNKSQIKTAIELAKSVKGVKKVESKLSIKK